MSYTMLRDGWYNIIVPAEEKNDDSKESFYEELEEAVDHFQKYHTIILLDDFDAKLEGEDILKQRTGNEILRQDSNDNGVKSNKFFTYKNVIVKSTMFSNRNIHKYTRIYPDRKTNSDWIDRVLIDRRRQTS
jgi:hypothetical protein